MALHHLTLLPRDGLFCKDGRGWYSSSLGRGYGVGWPFPSTVLGALRTAYGRAAEAAESQVFGPSEWQTATGIHLRRSVTLRGPVALAKWEPDHRVWPVPADALFLKNVTTTNVTTTVRALGHCLQPLPDGVETRGSTHDPARERLWWPWVEDKAKPDQRPPWWSDAMFVRWLSGKAENKEGGGKGFRLEHRLQVRLQIDPATLTGSDGHLYSSDILETLQYAKHSVEEAGDAAGAFSWAIGCEVEIGAGQAPGRFAEPPAGYATLGSDRMLAEIGPLDQAVFAMPEGLAKAIAAPAQDGRRAGLRLIAVTPLDFNAGWCPDGFCSDGTAYRGQLPGLPHEFILRAALVPRPLAVSGWDMAAKNGRGAPKKTTRLVPPGAVFFFERADGNPLAADDAKKLWLTDVGGRTGEGYGRVVPGVWHFKDR